MTRTAILSDIHGNLEALEEVLRDLEGQRVDRVLVLGDTVGYGPNPRECLERSSAAAELLLIGNHEADLIEPDPAMQVDEELREWTAAQLEGSSAWASLRAEVSRLGIEGAASRRLDGLHLVHASADAPTVQYIWPAHPCQYLVFNQQIGEHLAATLAAFEERIGFCGHTHIPAVLTEYALHSMFDPYEAKLDWDTVKTFVSPQALFVVPLGSVKLSVPPAGRIVINPGSVGQPRDGSTAASYVVFDEGTFELRRVPYELTPTLRKLAELPIEDDVKAELVRRLEHGE